MRISNVFWILMLFAAVCGLEVGVSTDLAHAEEPAKGTAKQVDLGRDVTLEIVYVPPGEFKMGSTAAEKEWAVGQDGGALFSSGGGAREAYEGEPRPMRVKDGFWMGRTEVSVGQFRRFVDETDYISDAEKSGGTTMCFDQNWNPNISNSGKPPHPCDPSNTRSTNSDSIPCETSCSFMRASKIYAFRFAVRLTNPLSTIVLSVFTTVV